MTPTKLVIATFCLFVSGCVTTHQPANMSKANQVISAANIGQIRDIQPPSNLRRNTKTYSTSELVLAQNNLKWRVPQDNRYLNNNWLISWIPPLGTSSPKDAQGKLFLQAIEAFNQTVDTRILGDPNKFKKVSDHALMIDFGGIKQPGNCPQSEKARCYMGLSFSKWESKADAEARIEGVKIAYAPPFIGSAQRYLSVAGLIDQITLTNEARSSSNSLLFWRKFSEKLPEYSFVYLAPERYTLQKNQKTEVGVTPLILNQGRAFTFIRGG